MDTVFVSLILSNVFIPPAWKAIGEYCDSKFLLGVGMCSDPCQTEEHFKIHTNRGSKQGVYVQSEDCNSVWNLTLYVSQKTYLQANR